MCMSEINPETYRKESESVNIVVRESLRCIQGGGAELAVTVHNSVTDPQMTRTTTRHNYDLRRDALVGHRL